MFAGCIFYKLGLLSGEHRAGQIYPGLKRYFRGPYRYLAESLADKGIFAGVLSKVHLCRLLSGSPNPDLVRR